LGSAKVKYFSFGMFDNETKTIKEFGKNIVTAEQMRIRNGNELILNNKKTIVNKEKDGNWNIEIFKPFFYNIEKRREI